MAYPETTDHVQLVNTFISLQMSAAAKGLRLETTGNKFRLILGDYVITEQDSIYAIQHTLGAIKKIEQ